MGLIVTTATLVSFVSAPVLSFINTKVMYGNTIDKKEHPKGLIKIWSQFGIAMMTLFSLFYIWLIFVN